MKKTKTLFIVTGLVLISISLAALPAPVGAWNNGDGGSGYSSFADNATNYNYNYHFGTHDWIALAALDALISGDSSEWQWLNARKAVYLVGTEAPDNAGVEMILDGDSVSGFGDTSSHHIYFNEDSSIKNNEDDSALRAKSTGDLANARFGEGKLDQAAYYLGAMTHYISDMSMYAHVAENNVPPYNINFDLHHSDVESYVQTRTNEEGDMEDFFLISSVGVGSRKPYNAAVDLAWDTYNDSSNGYAHNAAWIHDNFFSPWVQHYEDRSGDTSTHQEYYDRIEVSLNNAIKACVDAINYEVGTHTSAAPTDDDDDDDEEEGAIAAYTIPLIIACIGAATAILAWRLRRRIKT